MAIQPKTPRKRAVKKSKSEVAPEISGDEEVTPKKGRAASIPVPVFQAADAKAPRATRAKKSE